MAEEQREDDPVRREEAVAAGVDVDRASMARVYDYLLGGTHNFAVDRLAAQAMDDIAPGARDVMRAQRAFVRRTVRFLAEQGFDQFLDIGSGIPTEGNVHEIVQAVNPDAHVVYVDIDPAAVAHSRLILRENRVRNADVLQADVRHPQEVLDAESVRRLIDFFRPVAVLMCFVLHFVADEDEPARLLTAYTDALAPGSALVFSHGTADADPDARSDEAIASYRRTTSYAILRSRTEVAPWLSHLDLVEPGLVSTAHWRPDPDEDPDAVPLGGYGAIGIVRGNRNSANGQRV